MNKKIFLFIIIFSILAFNIIAYTTFKIVSLSPLITKEIYELGEGKNLIADTVYCQYPEDAKNKIKIGDMLNINIEKILELKPDIIFATELNNKYQVEILKQFGLKVVTLHESQSFSDLCRNFLKISKELGKIDIAKAIIKKSEQEIKKTIDTARVNNNSKPKVLAQIGINPLFIATKNTIINDLLQRINCINIGANTSNGIYSIEQVIKNDPDVIIISGMGVEENLNNQQKEWWQKYPTIKAVKNNNVYAINSYDLCTITVASYPKILKKLMLITHNQKG